jgi:hypothetical protein
MCEIYFYSVFVVMKACFSFFLMKNLAQELVTFKRKRKKIRKEKKNSPTRILWLEK